MSGHFRLKKDIPNPLGDKRRVHGNPWELPVVPAGLVVSVVLARHLHGDDTMVMAYDSRRGRLWLVDPRDTLAEVKKRAARWGFK